MPIDGNPASPFTACLPAVEHFSVCHIEVAIGAAYLWLRRSRRSYKTRLVPLHATTCTILRRYARQRDAHLDPPRSPYFFVSEQGGRLLHQYVYTVFWRLSRQNPSDHTGPRIHDFRHRFAVRTLVRWYRSGQPIELLLPVLSTYLGRVCVQDTYWYLSGCPELLGEAVKRLDHRWEAAS